MHVYSAMQSSLRWQSVPHMPEEALQQAEGADMLRAACILKNIEHWIGWLQTVKIATFLFHFSLMCPK